MAWLQPQQWGSTTVGPLPTSHTARRAPSAVGTVISTGSSRAAQPRLPSAPVGGAERSGRGGGTPPEACAGDRRSRQRCRRPAPWPLRGRAGRDGCRGGWSHALDCGRSAATAASGRRPAEGDGRSGDGRTRRAPTRSRRGRRPDCRRWRRRWPGRPSRACGPAGSRGPSAPAALGSSRPPVKRVDRRDGGIDEAGADGGHAHTLGRPVGPQALGEMEHRRLGAP